MDKQDLQNRFRYHPQKDGEQAVRYESLRQKALEFADLIDQFCPDSREKSLAVTNVEQGLMWAIGAIARNE